MLSPVELSNAGPLCSIDFRFDAARAQAQWSKARKKPVCFIQKGLKRRIFNGYNS
jgi:hypothetical protein